MNTDFYRRLIGIGSLFACLGVITGAFGAHALRSRIPEDSLDVLKTAVLYMFIHSLAIILVAVIPGKELGERWIKTAGVSFITGILLFSGSLLLISTSSLTGIHSTFIGILTPLGGLCFILGWFSLICWGFRYAQR